MWKNKNIWILMVGVLGAELGMWFGLIGNLDFLQSNVESSFYQSLILVLATIAGIIVGPFTTIIDLYNKKMILIFAGIARIIGVIFMLLAIQSDSILWMLGSMILIGVASAFYFPVIQAIIPLILEEEHLLEANAFQMNVMTLARIVGAALAGALLLLIPLYQLYVLSLCAYVILLISTIFIQLDDNKDKISKGKIGKSKVRFREIFPVIKSNEKVYISLFLSIIPYIFIAGFNIIVIEISNIQDNQSIKGVLYAVEGASIIITGFLVKSLIKKQNVLGTLLFSGILISISQFLLIFSKLTFMPIIAFFLFGVACGLFIPLSSTLYQKEVPSNYLGRFFSFKRIFETTLGQISLITIGILLDGIGLSILMGILGAFSLILVFTFLIVKYKNNSKIINKHEDIIN